MTDSNLHAPTQEQIVQLASQGCTAGDWSQVKIEAEADLCRLRQCNFLGDVTVCNLSGRVSDVHGVEKPCGISNATIINCSIGKGVRIANVRVHICNYDIGDNVCIEDVGTIQTNAGAAFGNGIRVKALNEAGGREVVIFDELNSQFAYLMCLHRYRPKMIEKLEAMADRYAGTVRSDRGTIGTGAKICSAQEIIDVRIGPAAAVNGAASLTNGTILSRADAPAIIGAGVIAQDFIVAESSSVTGEAILEKTFVGQGCLIGEQFSAKDSLFFANCECFHGEACSVFAGPYTVTHHRSTLLIAGLFSFYNAGSGTNQSNHMYKLGPLHEGKLLRGTKTGSFSYMMWPCRTGPFSVVLGKHSGTFDVEDYPFSHIEARPDGKANFVPGLHLTTVGIARDAAKWPKRDRRKGDIKRDRITFDVFSPYTAGKMLKARAQLQQLQQTTDKGVEEVSVGGALVRRPILRAGQKYYRNGIELYLLEKVMQKLEDCNKPDEPGHRTFAAEADAIYSDQWFDIGGQLMCQERLRRLQDKIEMSGISDISQFYEEIEQIRQAYVKDEWLWVKTKFKDYFGLDLDNATRGDLLAMLNEYQKAKSKFLNLVSADAEKEFAKLSRTGFGQDGSAADAEKDFAETRGCFEANSFVKEIKQALADLDERIGKMREKLNYGPDECTSPSGTARRKEAT